MEDFEESNSESSSSEQKQKFKAICTECKKECEVPFEPSEGRKVFCDECFSQRRRPRRNFNRGRFGDRNRNLYNAICAECNTECKVPFRPTQGKPVLCRECFSKKNSIEN
jgi:CxxC-x17-CxxC domain-containing protein